MKKAITLMVVGLFVACGMGAFVISSLQAQPVQAQVLPQPFVPYGGWVTAVVPPIVPPAPALCPLHTVIINADPASPFPVFGVYVPPGGEALLYDYKNIFTPGVPVLGGYLPIPFPTCNLPYPVFPIFFNTPFYLTGTGSL